MNKLPAEIVQIQTSGEIALITLLCKGIHFFSLIINHQENYIFIGNKVLMVFKETEVSIGKNLNNQHSIRNRFPTTIDFIHKGAILSEITLNFEGIKMISIITTGSADRLDLQEGDQVEALLKTNELLLMKHA